MSLTPEERRATVDLRLHNARQAHADAALLLERGSLRGTANRLYYAVYHALSAVALQREEVFRTHRGLIGFFYSKCAHGCIRCQVGSRGSAGL